MSPLPWKHCIRRSGKAGCPLLIKRQSGRSLFFSPGLPPSIFFLHPVLFPRLNTSNHTCQNTGGFALHTTCWISPAQHLQTKLHRTTGKPHIQPSSHSLLEQRYSCKWDDSPHIVHTREPSPCAPFHVLGRPCLEPVANVTVPPKPAGKAGKCHTRWCWSKQVIPGQQAGGGWRPEQMLTETQQGNDTAGQVVWFLIGRQKSMNQNKGIQTDGALLRSRAHTPFIHRTPVSASNPDHSNTGPWMWSMEPRVTIESHDLALKTNSKWWDSKCENYWPLQVEHFLSFWQN